MTETRNYSVVFQLLHVTNRPAGTGRALTDIRTRHYLNTILVSKLHQAAETPCSLVDRYCSFRTNYAPNVRSPATRLHGAINSEDKHVMSNWDGAPQWLGNDTQRPRGVVMNITNTTDLRMPGTVQQPHPNPALRISPHTRYLSTHSLPQNISQSVHHVYSI